MKAFVSINFFFSTVFSVFYKFWYAVFLKVFVSRYFLIGFDLNVYQCDIELSWACEFTSFFYDWFPVWFYYDQKIYFVMIWTFLSLLSIILWLSMLCILDNFLCALERNECLATHCWRRMFSVPVRSILPILLLSFIIFCLDGL
jgi:hypothetical protein